MQVTKFEFMIKNHNTKRTQKILKQLESLGLGGVSVIYGDIGNVIETRFHQTVSGHTVHNIELTKKVMGEYVNIAN